MLVPASAGTSREWFTEEERNTIWRKCHKVCACCGKPLTPKTMTIDHLVPLSRGGTNEMENLASLCYDCNQEKGSDFYFPFGWYHAIRGTPEYYDYMTHVTNWYRGLSKEEQTDLTKHPLITKQFLCDLYPQMNGFNGHRHKATRKVVPSMMVKLLWVGNFMAHEVEAVTGRNLLVDRSYIARDMAGGREVWPEGGAYIVKKMSTDKLLALFYFRYEEEQKTLYAYIPWADTSGVIAATLVHMAVYDALISLIDVAGKEVSFYRIDCRIPHGLDRFRHTGAMPDLFGKRFTCDELKDEEGAIDSIFVNRAF